MPFQQHHYKTQKAPDLCPPTSVHHGGGPAPQHPRGEIMDLRGFVRGAEPALHLIMVPELCPDPVEPHGHKLVCGAAIKFIRVLEHKKPQNPKDLDSELETYLNSFDVVITNEGTFDEPNRILNSILDI